MSESSISSNHRTVNRTTPHTDDAAARTARIADLEQHIREEQAALAAEDLMVPLPTSRDLNETARQSGQRDRETEHTPPSRQDLSLYLSVNSQAEQYLAAAVELADRSPLPMAAQRYQLPALKRLVAICHALQVLATDAPIHLSCRAAGKLLGINHQLAHSYLWRLVHDGVLSVVKIGKPGPGGPGTATRYRYITADQADASTSTTSTSTTSDMYGSDQSDPGPYEGRY